MYQPVQKANQLITGTGRIVIVTGWTPKEQIAKHLQPNQYAAIGNLYSPTRGISPLVRNLLANPQVYWLFILEATKEDVNAGSCQCLWDFFYHGVRKGKSDTDKDCWIINSKVTGYIDAEIPQEDLNLLKNIAVEKKEDISSLIYEVGYVNDRILNTAIAPWGTPKTYPENNFTPLVFPGVRHGHRIEGKTIAETWVKLLHRIKTTGTIRPTGYDGQWQELIDLMAIVTDEPEDFYFPEPNYLPIDRKFLMDYIPQMLTNQPSGTKYTYGQRMRSHFNRDQIEQIINKLIGEIDAASAVISLWDVADHDKGGSPCLNHIWVRVVDGELSLTATFRSNDMFGAWVANAMGLRALQRHIYQEIIARSPHQLTIGPLITISQSAHIYSDCWESVDNLINNVYLDIAKERNYNDPIGSFLISIENDAIRIEHITPGTGETIQVFKGKNPLKLIRKIAIDFPAIQPDHIGYLGLELGKAKVAIESNTTYTQDR